MYLAQEGTKRQHATSTQPASTSTRRKAVHGCSPRGLRVATGRRRRSLSLGSVAVSCRVVVVSAGGATRSVAVVDGRGAGTLVRATVATVRVVEVVAPHRHTGVTAVRIRVHARLAAFERSGNSNVPGAHRILRHHFISGFSGWTETGANPMFSKLCIL